MEKLILFIFIYLRFPSTWAMLFVFFMIYKILKKYIKKINNNLLNNRIIEVLLIIIYSYMTIYASIVVTDKYLVLRDSLNHKIRFEKNIENELGYNFFVNKGIDLKDLEKTLKDEFIIYCIINRTNPESGESFTSFAKRKLNQNKFIFDRGDYDYFSLDEIKTSINVSLDGSKESVNIPLIFNKDTITDDLILKARERMTYDYLEDIGLLGKYAELSDLNNEKAVLIEDFNEPNKEKVQILSEPFKLFAIYDNEKSLIEPIYFELESDYLVKSENKNNEEDNIKSLMLEGYKNITYKGDKDIKEIEFIQYKKENNDYIIEAYLYWSYNNTKTQYIFLIKDYSSSSNEVSGSVRFMLSGGSIDILYDDSPSKITGTNEYNYSYYIQ